MDWTIRGRFMNLATDCSGQKPRLFDSSRYSKGCMNDDRDSAPVVVTLLNKLRTANVEVEMHLYNRGGDAFNKGNRSPLKTISK